MTTPLGLIVEGTGEYVGVPNLIRKAHPLSHFRLPAINAGGVGRIIARLEELLVEIVRLHHPRTVIVTLDEADVVGTFFTSCESMRTSLDDRSATWLQSQAGNFGLHPLPQRIVTVVQSPFFESWLCGDPAGLASAHLTAPTFTPQPIADVDSCGIDHRQYLQSALRGGYRKRPAEVAVITKALDPQRIALTSRSFRKLLKEATAAYG